MGHVEFPVLNLLLYEARTSPYEGLVHPILSTCAFLSLVFKVVRLSKIFDIFVQSQRN